MKTLYLQSLLLALVIAGPLSSQTWLTRGEIYDFQPGDMFQIFWRGPCPCPGYDTIIQRAVLTRNMSSTSDTVYYAIEQSYWDLNANFPGRTDTVTEYYTDLNDPIVLPQYQNFVTNNFNYDAYGTELAETYSYNTPTSAVSHDSLMSYAVKGCGGPYYMTDQYTSSACYSYFTLVFYRKNGIDYGMPAVPANWIGVPETGVDVPEIFPNPSNGTVYVKNETGFISYGLCTLNGEVLEEGPITERTIVFGNLPTGIYILTLIASDGTVSRQRLIFEN